MSMHMIFTHPVHQKILWFLTVNGWLKNYENIPGVNIVVDGKPYKSSPVPQLYPTWQTTTPRPAIRPPFNPLTEAERRRRGETTQRSNVNRPRPTEQLPPAWQTTTTNPTIRNRFDPRSETNRRRTGTTRPLYINGTPPARQTGYQYPPTTQTTVQYPGNSLNSRTRKQGPNTNRIYPARKPNTQPPSTRQPVPRPPPEAPAGQLDTVYPELLVTMDYATHLWVIIRLHQLLQ